jgi:hypothetical protein
LPVAIRGPQLRIATRRCDVILGTRPFHPYGADAIRHGADRVLGRSLAVLRADAKLDELDALS